MNIAVFGNEIDNIMLFADSHRYRKVVDSFWREENVNGPLGEHGVCINVIDFDNVKLTSLKNDSRK